MFNNNELLGNEFTIRIITRKTNTKRKLISIIVICTSLPQNKTKKQLKHCVNRVADINIYIEYKQT